MGDMKSVVYLTCPVQRAEGWSYIGAISSFFQPGPGSSPGRGLLPARQLDFGDAITAKIFDETHSLATWVANYDELLDRRQLREQGVRIIRYKQLATQGRSLIISSRAPMGLLQSMIISRLNDLRLGLDGRQLRELADRFIGDANDISGDIVLRAAQRGTSASGLRRVAWLCCGDPVVAGQFGCRARAGRGVGEFGRSTPGTAPAARVGARHRAPWRPAAGPGRGPQARGRDLHPAGRDRRDRAQTCTWHTFLSHHSAC
jgi:hypothetical protein